MSLTYEPMSDFFYISDLCSPDFRERFPSTTIPKLTRWVRGTNLSTLERKRAQARQIGAPEYTHRFRTKREQLETFKGRCLKAQARIWPQLSCVSYLLDSGSAAECVVPLQEPPNI